MLRLKVQTLSNNCYGAPEGADGCNYFLQQSIPFKMSGALCPFNDASMHFSMGPVNARVLGINTPMPIEISRETTCAPITVNGSFVEMHIKNTSVLPHYYYGMSF